MDGWIWKLEQEPFHIPLSPEQEQQFGTVSEGCQKIEREVERTCDSSLWEAYQDQQEEVNAWNRRVAFRDGFHMAAEFFLEILCHWHGV